LIGVPSYLSGWPVCFDEPLRLNLSLADIEPHKKLNADQSVSLAIEVRNRARHVGGPTATVDIAAARRERRPARHPSDA
jgi:hypothetical protein